MNESAGDTLKENLTPKVPESGAKKASKINSWNEALLVLKDKFIRQKKTHPQVDFKSGELGEVRQVEEDVEELTDEEKSNIDAMLEWLDCVSGGSSVGSVEDFPQDKMLMEKYIVSRGSRVLPYLKRKMLDSEADEYRFKFFSQVVSAVAGENDYKFVIDNIKENYYQYEQVDAVLHMLSPIMRAIILFRESDPQDKRLEEIANELQKLLNNEAGYDIYIASYSDNYYPLCLALAATGTKVAENYINSVLVPGYSYSLTKVKSFFQDGANEQPFELADGEFGFEWHTGQPLEPEELDSELEAKKRDLIDVKGDMLYPLRAPFSFYPTADLTSWSLDDTERSPSDNQEEALERFCQRLKDIVDAQPIGSNEWKLFDAIGISGDSDRVEGHQIKIVRGSDNIIISFKLTEPMLARIRDIVSKMAEENKYIIQRGDIEFRAVPHNLTPEKSSEELELRLTKIGKALTINLDGGVKVHIADNEPLDPGYIRSLNGAVIIELPADKSPAELGMIMHNVSGQIGIPDLLCDPNREAIRKYKMRRFMWFHQMSEIEFGNYSREYSLRTGRDILDELTYEEVFPGYSTILRPGYADYFLEKFGIFYLTQGLKTGKRLPLILSNGALSSSERVLRGLPVSGSSSLTDFRKGSADFVFTRVKSKRDRVFSQQTLIYKPQVLDRLDWFAYLHDRYGTTEPDTFALRPTPEQFIQQSIIKSSDFNDNELMLHRGIGVKDMLALAVKDSDLRLQLIDRMYTNGIEEVNGMPIDQFIIKAHNFGEVGERLNSRI